MNLYLKKARKSILIIFLLLIAANIHAQQNSKITIKEREISIQSALMEVRKQSNMSVAYNDSKLPKQKISLNIDKQPLEKALDIILQSTGFTYIIKDDYIMIVLEKKVKDGKNRKVTGKVVDSKGEPLIGVTVREKGTNNGTITDINGNYKLTTQTVSSVLVFSYVGYLSEEVSATRNTLNVTLEDATQELNEVVVTALGIKKETKALTYNVQELKATELVMVKDANFMNALAGKIAGVTINTSSSGVGGSARVVMRGTKSISGNNNALYVVDGIPLPNLSSIQPSDLFTGMGQSGDGISTLNPDDIESMSVLTGAAAAALYGSDAANGVVMITTKKGQVGKLSIDVSNSTTFSAPFVTPEFQNSYGTSSVGEFASWSDTPLSTPSKYNPIDFFQTGYNVNNSISLSTGTETNQTYFSVATVNARGIIHNNDLARYNFSFRNSSSMLNDHLHLDLSFMYMRINEQNMLAQGQYFNPLVPVYLFPRSDDFAKYQTFERYDPSRNFKTQYWPYGDQGMMMQNPYWITERDKFNNYKDRFLTGAGLKYDLADWINVSARVKYDGTKEVRTTKYYASTLPLFAGSDMGAYFKDHINTTQIYADAMLNIDKYIGDFSLRATLGASICDVQYDFSNFGGPLQSTANLFTYANVTRSTATWGEDSYHDQNQALFATAQLGYRSMIYLDVTGRNDWPSALAGTKHKNKGFFYPSVGVSTVLTELLPIKSKVLSFMKARFSYSQVGNAPQRHIPISTYHIQDGFPQTTTYLVDDDLKPERRKSFEVGLNAKLFGDKVNMDLTLYKSSTYNQLFNPTLPTGSGYTTYYVNAGRIDNKGIEFSLGLDLDLGPINWTSNATYSINKNRIKELLPETIAPTGAIVKMSEMNMGGTDGYRMVLKEGHSMGDIYVNTLKTDEHGYILVDIESQKVTADPDNFVYAGNANPDYTIGWRNNFEWKGLSLGFAINGRFGRQIHADGGKSVCRTTCRTHP